MKKERPLFPMDGTVYTMYANLVKYIYRIWYIQMERSYMCCSPSTFLCGRKRQRIFRSLSPFVEIHGRFLVGRVGPSVDLSRCIGQCTTKPTPLHTDDVVALHHGITFMYLQISFHWLSNKTYFINESSLYRVSSKYRYHSTHNIL